MMGAPLRMAHLVARNIGFAASALDNADIGAFVDVQLAADPVVVLQFATSASVVAAFAGPDLEHDRYLAAVRGGTSWPAHTGGRRRSPVSPTSLSGDSAARVATSPQ